MIEPIYFKTRDDFREWLEENCTISKGVWLGFGKIKEIQTLKASEALEEALCFGWIDGMMKRIDDKVYMKYFSARRKNSKWSQKNKTLAISLEKRELMTDFGRAKINEAKENGQWSNASKPCDISDKQIEVLIELLREYKCAHDNFKNMSLSVKKTYTRAYLDAKTESGRIKRLAWIVDRLEKNLKPM